MRRMTRLSGGVLLGLILGSVSLAAARSVVATDAFTGANGASPAAQWTVTAGTPRIFTNGLRGEAAGDSMVINTGTFATDHYSAVQIATLPSSDEIQAIVRFTDSSNFYGAAYDGATSVTVYKLVAGSFSVLATRTGSWSIGDTLDLEVTGTSGSTILRVLKNGVQVGADVAVSATFNNTGKPGVNLWRSGAGVTTARADAIEVGDLTAGGGTPARSQLLLGVGGN